MNSAPLLNISEINQIIKQSFAQNIPQYCMIKITNIMIQLTAHS